MNFMLEIDFYEGSTFLAADADYWTSGIDAGSVHGNMIEVYGKTKQDAMDKRLFVLRALQHYQEMFENATKNETEIQCLTSG